MSAASQPATPALALVPKRPKLTEFLESTEAILDTLDGLDEAESESRDALSRMLIESIAGTKSKIDSTCHVLANLETAEAAAKAERDRLDARMKYFARQTERLSAHLLAVLNASKLDRIDGNTSAIARKKNPPSVIVTDERELPAEFWRSPPVPPIPADQPDKSLIAKALKADPDSVPGCRLQQDYRLQRS